MKNTKSLKIAGFAGSFALTLGLLGAATVATGAYFQDSESGTVTGTVGSIDIKSEDLAITFTDVLPGVPQTSTVTFSNDGNNAQDVYIQFGSQVAQLAQYGTLKVGSTAITGSTALLLAEDFAPDAEATVSVTFELKSTVTDEQIAPYVDDAAAATLPFTLIATQQNVPVNA